MLCQGFTQNTVELSAHTNVEVAHNVAQKTYGKTAKIPFWSRKFVPCAHCNLIWVVNIFAVFSSVAPAEPVVEHTVLLFWLQAMSCRLLVQISAVNNPNLVRPRKKFQLFQWKDRSVPVRFSQVSLCSEYIWRCFT